jgi:hypothetical protein
VGDAIPESVEVIDGSTIALAGVFLPADERHQWIQPFRAELQLDPARTRLASSRIFLCDASVAIDAVSYGERRPRTWPQEVAWVFHFDYTAGEPSHRSAPPSGP